MKAAILGHPVQHSLSPVLHSAAYEALGLHDWTYEKHDVTTEQLASFLSECDATWAGVSLTMPLKLRAVELASSSSEVVSRTGVANTLIFESEGLRAFNTDVDGIKFALAEVGITAVHSARVIGGGATARSAVAALEDLGATDISLAVRRPGATQGIPDVSECALSEDSAVDVVISTVPSDATTDVPALSCPLLDVIYHPWPTPLATRWLGPVTSGHRMLLGQAVHQVHLMTGMKVTPVVVQAMDAALMTALQASH